MDKKTFLNLLLQKDAFNETTLKEIKTELQQFEWCSLLQMLYLKNTHHVQPEIFENLLPFTSCYAIDRSKLQQLIFPFETKEKIISRKKPKVVAEIIDRFIQNEPSVTKLSDSAPSLDVAQQSIKEHDDLASETLAKIYLKQGNYQKAIQIFEKLSLIIPEKSSYFAAQIDKIRKQHFQQ
ncbi:MAG: tetratricopeptide repeat protein [Bacteroidota bacterium]